MFNQSHTYIYCFQKKRRRKWLTLPLPTTTSRPGTRGRPVKQITDSLIAVLKKDLVQELLEVLLLPVNIFVHSFTELFQVDSLGNFKGFIEKATQRRRGTLCTGEFGDHIKVRGRVRGKSRKYSYDHIYSLASNPRS